MNMTFEQIMEQPSVKEFNNMLNECDTVKRNIDINNEEMLAEISEHVSYDTNVDEFADKFLIGGK